MAPTSRVHRPHHVRNEGREKRGKLDLLMWEPIHPELFACYFFAAALTSPVSARCLMRGECILFIADTTLASFRAGLSAGDESGCNILSVHWPGCAQSQASGRMKSQAAAPSSPWPWESCASHSRDNHMRAQEFKVRLCFLSFTRNTKGSKIPSSTALKAAEKARRWVGANFPPCPPTGDRELLSFKTMGSETLSCFASDFTRTQIPFIDFFLLKG